MTGAGRCGNDRRTRLTPGDAAAVDAFRDYLQRRKEAKEAGEPRPELPAGMTLLVDPDDRA
ncbi:hypothetical protein QMK19_35340 [Streptomyces sp. H10-C2]|uniref:hypothetical protein n=1 Tax=unclassified Streptomyces TaxID=2593676 RepID=UPI0024BA16C3|nr:MULTISPECIES: hypothetical protein [unclassified Streptomyces]MDJ0345910.1 hypothetical protein [Streptomyces sp. PH10-H1]MDJ0374759.1 hypothetical protein [Streptomyces sp. H10-C2]